MQTTDENLIAYNNLSNLCITLLIKLIVYGDGLTINSIENLNDIKIKLDNLINDKPVPYAFKKEFLNDSFNSLYVKLEDAVLQNIIIKNKLNNK